MTAVRRELRFLVNDEEVALGDAGASDSLLDFLRLRRGLRGTKEGCAEGDCGACTVLVGRLRDGDLRYEAVNSCIRLLPSLDGCHVVTVEHLAGADGGLHPVQQAMVDCHGSQCGFCTPGIVMVLYALWLERPRPSEAEVRRALQGNLCRCTGYAPILRAGAVAADYGLPEDDGLVRSREAVATRLTAMVDGKRVELAGGSVVVPVDEDDLADALESEPAATMVAGATDVGVWVNKDLRDIAPAVFIGHMDGLGRIAAEGGTIGIGATASYSDAEAALTEAVPGLAGYWSRIGGWQIRNMGTVGGNIANGSPIADLPPVLIALGAELVLRKGRERRAMPLEAYFLDYGRQDRAPGEFVEGVRVPVPAEDARLGFYKVSKRRDEDISSVCAGLMVRVRDGCIEEARLAFGGMAATPKRAEAAEAALRGRAWGEPAFEAAEQALERDFTPISDWRASAEYRALVARNLLKRFYLDRSGTVSP